ncbi:MAG: hypothetical protein AAF847_16405 [Bacteroidota bacterium]
MSTNEQSKGNLTQKQARQRRIDWMNCPTNQLQELFYSCRVQEGLIERHRAIAYYLPQATRDSKDWEEVVAHSKEIKGFSVCMGCKAADKKDELNNSSMFAPFLVIKMDKQEYYFDLQCDFEVDIFSSNGAVSNNLDVPITRQTALHFIQAWCECSYSDLAAAFEGKVGLRKKLILQEKGKEWFGKPFYLHETRRVHSYSFQADVENIVPASSSFLYVVMGIGQPHTATDHPFAFRPIILTQPLDPSQNNSGSGAYEFSRPCPPKCSDT